jgi:predicted  nucleic acid-binding Zn-ribbon protein
MRLTRELAASMTSPQPYGGPASLAYSRFATQQRLPLPSLPSLIAGTSTPNIIATKEQIAATNADEMAPPSSDVELAYAEGMALKDDIEKHSLQFTRTVSSTVTNTHRLLELIRENNKDDDSSLQTVDELWADLERLFEAAKGATDALPSFLEKQRNNMALYHSSQMNETYLEAQQELNMQHKKVNLQHGLILEHQQAFQDFKAKTATKLAELEELQESVSRLTLEKGNYRGEIDKYLQMLEQESATKVEDQKKLKALQTELATLNTSKQNLVAETETLRKTISGLEDEIKAAQQVAADRSAVEHQAKEDQLAKESTKIAHLNTVIEALKGDGGNSKKEVEKLKTEFRLLNDKYIRMGAEHAQAFNVSLV